MCYSLRFFMAAKKLPAQQKSANTFSGISSTSFFYCIMMAKITIISLWIYRTGIYNSTDIYRYYTYIREHDTWYTEYCNCLYVIKGRKYFLIDFLLYSIRIMNNMRIKTWAQKERKCDRTEGEYFWPRMGTKTKPTSRPKLNDSFIKLN